MTDNNKQPLPSEPIKELPPRKTFIKRFWWLIPLGLLITAGIVFAVLKFLPRSNDQKGSDKKSIIEQIKDSVSFEQCPSNLGGILTYQLVDLSKISSLTPLGNLNPPGHTSPVDHIYFSTNTTEKIPLYAPADSTITHIIALYQDIGQGYVPTDFVVQYTICKGLILDFAGYSEIIEPLRNEIENKQTSCKGDIVKEGHEGKQKQCGYNLSYKVKSGELIGYTQGKFDEKSNSVKLPFEIWAANYNQSVPSNIDWSFYNDDRYAHIMCPFDLYTGDLKKQFYAKLGGETTESTKDPITGKEIRGTPKFTARTIDPICGTVNQNIAGTIQGMWFGEDWKNRADKDFVDDTRQFSFLHWNIDPTYAELGNAGEITQGDAGQVQFLPKHSGKIDREPSEVKADGAVYCYNYSRENREGKILAQLIDDRHLKLEYQGGSCTDNETLTNPYTYER